ncbi:MAG: uL15 family ribosomal protein [Clostridia bacterium]|nr:uL15 family ribosomal protein [Clostridia bacterium]
MFQSEEAVVQTANEDSAPWDEDAHVAVRAEEVDSLMTDKEVKEYQKMATVPTEHYTGSKKAQVNVDTISEAFADGDTVTLNSLKEKKLIAKNVGFVKILARGKLDKSLIVIAQDFSMAAVKMILLTGGQAIVTKPSAERKGKKS